MSAALKSTFLYFAYGSNMLRERLHFQNPSAVFVNTARLDKHKLEFDYPSQTWQGAAATVSPSEKDHVWGVVWSIDSADQENLDSQEGVEYGTYEVTALGVVTPGGETLTCRSYRLMKCGYPDRRPSPHYMDVIVRGAVQHKLPQEYIDALRRVDHNGYYGPVELYKRLNLGGDAPSP